MSTNDTTPAPEAAGDLSAAEWEQVALAGFRAEFPTMRIDDDIRTSWTEYAKDIFLRGTHHGKFYDKGLPAMQAAHAAILASRTPSPATPQPEPVREAGSAGEQAAATGEQENDTGR